MRAVHPMHPRANVAVVVSHRAVCHVDESQICQCYDETLGLLNRFSDSPLCMFAGRGYRDTIGHKLRADWRSCFIVGLVFSRLLLGHFPSIRCKRLCGDSGPHRDAVHHGAGCWRCAVMACVSGRPELHHPRVILRPALAHLSFRSFAISPVSPCPSYLHPCICGLLLLPLGLVDLFRLMF